VAFSVARDSDGHARRSAPACQAMCSPMKLAMKE
jgi:hypothetical protein